jgi:hypothetical protein
MSAHRPHLQEGESWATLGDVPDDTFEISCTACPISETVKTSDLLQRFSSDTYLWIVVEKLTENCSHRRPYSGLPACGARTKQGKSAVAAIQARHAAAEERNRQAAIDRAEAMRQQEERERNADIRVADRNGWRLFEAIPTGTRPKYRWQQSWEDDHPADIIGFDGAVPIGRVFQFAPHMINKDVWFWVLYGVEARKRKRPGQGAGWEQSRLLAVCRVEWCYERMFEEEAQAEKWRRGK